MLRRLLVPSCLALLAAAAGAQPSSAPGAAAAPASRSAPALPAGVTAVTSIEGITEYRLANGLQVLLVPDDSKPITTVNMTYRVGSRHENYGESGMAHLLEHLIFKGTPTTRNALGEFSRRGLRANGTTFFDRTNYFASFSADDENLRWYLGWQADVMVNSFIARADLDTEMTVVRNEFERGENNPGRVLWQQTMAAMYSWHAYGRSVIGARSDIENVDIPRLQAFYRRHYQPDNATLIVAGRFDPARTLGWIAESFGPLPRPARALQPTYTLDAAQDGERTVTVRRVGGNPTLYLAFHVPPGSSPDFAAVSLLSSVLASPPAGRLHKRLVERQLAASTFGFALGLAEPGAMFLGASLAPGQDVERARAELLATVDDVARQPVTDEELNRARTQWLNEWEQGFTDPAAVGVQISEAVALGDWRLFFLQRDQVKALTLADLNRVAGERLRRDNRTLGQYLPTDAPQRAPAPARVDVAALVKDYKGDPTAAAIAPFDYGYANLQQQLQQATLASGMRVALLPKPSRGGAAHARIRLHYGDADSLRGQEAVSMITASLLDKGGAGLTRQQIADRFDALRAEVSIRAQEQTLAVDITSTRANLPAAVELVGRLLRQPAFPPEVLEETRRQWLAALERQKKEPEALIANALQRHGNPYPRGDLRHAPTFEESEADVRAVTPAQLRDFHARFYSAARSEFAATGDFDAAALRGAVQSAFGDWGRPAAGPRAYVRVPRPLVAVPPQRFVLQTPDKQNANLLAELSLPLADTDAEYPALLMANYIFGLSTSSRLWTRIREVDGLAYDVRSSVDWSRFEPNSRWAVSASFAPQNRARVETALNEEFARATKDGFTQAELDQARNGLLNLLRLSLSQDAAVAAQAAQNLHLGRDFGFLARRDEAVRALTLEQVNAAFRRHMQPSRWSIAWGGDFQAP